MTQEGTFFQLGPVPPWPSIQDLPVTHSQPPAGTQKPLGGCRVCGRSCRPLGLKAPPPPTPPNCHLPLNAPSLPPSSVLPPPPPPPQMDTSVRMPSTTCATASPATSCGETKRITSGGSPPEIMPSPLAGAALLSGQSPTPLVNTRPQVPYIGPATPPLNVTVFLTCRPT